VPTLDVLFVITFVFEPISAILTSIGTPVKVTFHVRLKAKRAFAVFLACAPLTTERFHTTAAKWFEVRF
jgi:hypothetical protein